MNITWKKSIDPRSMYVSKRAYVDSGEIIILKDNGGFHIAIYNNRFGRSAPITFKPFKTETEAMIKAHMLIENHRHDLFPLRSFKTLQNDVVGYKAVILYSPVHDLFDSRILKVTIPKGTIIHNPDYCSLDDIIGSELKYRAQDAIINYIVDYPYSIYDITDDDVILSAHRCSQVLDVFDGGYGYYYFQPDKFIKQVKDLGGVYSECMSIHIPDFSWEDTECGEGFHYFLTYDDAKRYSIRFGGLINTLNKYVNKKEERL